MTPLVAEVSKILSFLTILADLALAAGLVCFISRKNSLLARRAVGLVDKHSLLLAFIITFSALVLSIFYSDIAGFAPCELCWIQRIFIYPQFFMLALAAWRKDKGVIDYLLLLSVIGALVAAYNCLVQFGGSAFALCGASVVSCTKIYFTEFGYVTIPVMSLTAFLMLIEIYLASKFSKK